MHGTIHRRRYIRPDIDQIYIQTLMSDTGKRLHTHGLLQRPIHKPVRAIQIHRTSHLPALHHHNASLPARLYRRRHHAPEPERARTHRRRGFRERRAVRTRRHRRRQQQQQRTTAAGARPQSDHRPEKRSEHGHIIT